MKTYLLPPLLLLLIAACQPEPATDKAAEVVNQAIEVHGGDAFEENAKLAFEFRDRTYMYQRNGGTFEYRRIFTDSTGEAITDILNNSGFVRLVNGDTVQLAEERQQAYSSSVNSVIYFALLPYRLNDAAVQKEYLGQVEIEGEPYDKVKVTFAEEGGGEDHEDTFVYWFHANEHTLDYLAYQFHTDGGGYRFRKAYNPRQTGGILWLDYINYKPEVSKLAVEEMDSLFAIGKLEELSRIELENIRVIE
ncbi:DUF6503 family protein [Nafulsella turpanensis]|uniref:DUF6503 family protein n=1 Tax=Nafulsella turpanensis TaxID=1265690 RepID=UPI00034910D8|nr:DUF6503 family protein [Nafulsella turpanensis]